MRPYVVMVVSCGLCACGGTGGPTDMASLSGQVRVFQGASSAQRPSSDSAAPRAALAALQKHALAPHPSGVAARAAARLQLAPAKALPRILVGNTAPYGVNAPERIRPGEVIVRFHEKLTAKQAAARLQVNGYRFTHGGFASEYLHLARYVTARGLELTEGQTRELVASLARRAGIKFTEPNGVRHALAVPNDNLYPAMWHLPPINLPAAWDLEKGNTNSTVVAVVDTGILGHPDITPRLVAGIDMISDPGVANDGDGRDTDPTDPGHDQPNGSSSYHGSHCAGTIGAATDNGTGIAGVNWNAKVQPVRVLGKGGGTDFDIAAGMNWASGGTVPGAPANPTPAAVVSMSLGGKGGPLQSYQDVIDAAGPRNVIFVVAAGNDNIDASGFTPCNQTGILCIGATRFNGKRASYSNFGQRVDLMAPGGEMAEDSNGDGYPDGVLSLGKDDSDNSAVYKFENGTSMATPHVAGIVSLMKSRLPQVTFSQVRSALTSTANTDSQCSEGCGAGLVNVLAALQQISGTAPAGPARLSLGTAELFFTTTQSAQALQVTNTGGQPLNVSLAVGGAEAQRIDLEATQFQLAPGASRALGMSANLSGLTEGTTASASLSVGSNGGNATVTLKLRSGGASGAQRSAAIALVYLDTAGMWQVKATAEAMPSGFTWSLGSEPGKYYLFGVQDSNGNGDFEDNEPLGFYPNNDSPKELVLAAGDSLSGLDFTLAPLTNLSDDMASVIGAACADDGPCAPGVCGTGFPGGYCTQDCSSAACPLGARCVSGADFAFCLASCSGVRAGQSDCRGGYVCEDDGTGSGVCIPACTGDAACEPSTCDLSTGYCR
ncbi:MAG: S8 family peptidase [Archangiaceae bacterium]|nr:S8 family peptidase [Archangiaceae bacterium]